MRQSAVDHYNSKACAPDRSKQCPDYADRASLTRALGIISAATAGALIVTGVVLIVTDHDAEPSDETASATRCGIGPLGVSCAGSF